MTELIDVSRFDTKRDFKSIQLFTLKNNKGIKTQIQNVLKSCLVAGTGFIPLLLHTAEWAKLGRLYKENQCIA